jgi:hypothetical protein
MCLLGCISEVLAVQATSVAGAGRQFVETLHHSYSCGSLNKLRGKDMLKRILYTRRAPGSTPRGLRP